MEARRPLATVTPTVDGLVLQKLASVNSAFSPGEISRFLPEVSLSGIRKVLARLTAQGIVIEKRAGRSAYVYSLNRDHMAAAPIIELADLWERVNDRIASTIAEWDEQPVYAAIFGSWARRRAGVESDIDLFFVLPDDYDYDTWQQRIGPLEDLLWRWTGNDVQSVRIERGAVHRDPATELFHEVVRDAVQVGGDHDWLRTELWRIRAKDRGLQLGADRRAPVES